MALNLMCPNLRCRQILSVPDKTRGNRLRCSYCGHIFLVPWARGFKGKPFDEEMTPEQRYKLTKYMNNK